MNAYELAEAIRYCGDAGYNLDAHNMIRQQADRIAELEKSNKELHAIAQRMAMSESDARKSLQNFKDYEMSKPVAWLEPITGNVMKDSEYQNNIFANETDHWIPLYTHPVKQLSDEEIVKIHDSFGNGYVSYIDFARAIIKEITE